MLLVYAKTETGIAEVLQQRLNGRSTLVQLESYSNIEDLKRRLHHPPLKIRIGVFSIGSLGELDQIVAIRDLLADIRLVLVLFDNHAETLSKAHILAPRFITFADANMASLVSVVGKMIASQIKQVL